MKKQDQYSPSREVDCTMMVQQMPTWDTPTMEQRKARTGGRILTAYTDRSKSLISDTAHIQFSVAPEGNRHERRKAMSNKVRRNKRKHQRMFVGVPR